MAVQIPFGPKRIMYLYNADGIPRKIDDLMAVKTLFDLKEKSGSNPWPVIEKCVEIWQKKHPQEWKSYLIELQETKETRRDKKFASVHDKFHDGYLRYTLDIPETVMYMVRCIYNARELPMNREFFQEWAKKFPKMKVAQKL